MDAIAEQLRGEQFLTQHRDPAAWADRAAYYWSATLHAHPFREGNRRSCRIWLGELAEQAGHQLDWRRTSAERNVNVAVSAAGHGQVEPMRALLTQVAGGIVGADRPRQAFDDLDKLLRARAGLTSASSSAHRRNRRSSSTR